VITRQALDLDAHAEVNGIVEAIRVQTLGTLARRGIVVGISGGIDSSVVAALSARALGPARVLGLLMPERDSSDDSTRLGRLLAEAIGIATLTEDITPMLEAAACYERQTRAIRRVFPGYAEGQRFKIRLPSILAAARLNVPLLAVETDEGVLEFRLSAEASQELVAATNFKQRIRTMLEYYHADRLHYAVAGTPNRLEYDQGFFVKQGDGAADLKPIAHLYKTQVYQIGELLGVPEEIRRRPPTTDTYPLAQTQEEFFFSLPYFEMDLCLYARNHGVPAADAAAGLGLTEEQVERVFQDIDQKRRSTRYLHRQPLLVQPVPEAAH
jgi:NAD+ synthase